MKLDPGPLRRMRTVSCLIVSLDRTCCGSALPDPAGALSDNHHLSGVLNHWIASGRLHARQATAGRALSELLVSEGLNQNQYAMPTIKRLAAARNRI